MIIGVIIAAPVITWAVFLAITASTARLGLSARLLHPVLTRHP
jgi:hypothetical protein